MTTEEREELKKRAESCKWTYLRNDVCTPAEILSLISDIERLEEENRIAMRTLVEAKRANRCPNDGRPLFFDNPNGGHCGFCRFTFATSSDWNYEPVPLIEARAKEPK